LTHDNLRNTGDHSCNSTDDLHNCANGICANHLEFVCGASANGGSGRGSGASRHLPTCISPRASWNAHSRALRMPQVNVAFPNVNLENIMERSR